jgi:hypothetical protein
MYSYRVLTSYVSPKGKRIGETRGCGVENFIQEEIFNTNLRDVRAQASKSTSEIRIPGTEISGGG